MAWWTMITFQLTLDVDGTEQRRLFVSLGAAMKAFRRACNQGVLMARVDKYDHNDNHIQRLAFLGDEGST
jgi:hypothetical protein